MQRAALIPKVRLLYGQSQMCLHGFRISYYRCLQYAGFVIFVHFDVPTLLQTDERTIFKWLVLMESFYSQANPYHNSTHAADVLQAASFFCKQHKVLVCLCSILLDLLLACPLFSAHHLNIDQCAECSDVAL